MVAAIGPVAKGSLGGRGVRTDGVVPRDGYIADLGDHPKAAIDDQVKSGHREKA
jgi:hypothetical protein